MKTFKYLVRHPGQGIMPIQGFCHTEQHNVGSHRQTSILEEESEPRICMTSVKVYGNRVEVHS